MTPSYRFIGLTSDEIISEVERGHPEVRRVLAATAERIDWSKRQIWPEQAAVLYALTRDQDRSGASILEVGTALGYSALIIAQAAPRARITTLNPKALEFWQATKYLKGCPSVTLLMSTSGDYLTRYDGPSLALVFVDGSHLYDHVTTDCEWFNWLEIGGLILFHDYSPEGSARPSPEVVRAVDEFADCLAREPDVLVIDDRQVGMAGWYRREGERYA